MTGYLQQYRNIKTININDIINIIKICLHVHEALFCMFSSQGCHADLNFCFSAGMNVTASQYFFAHNVSH
jgi:hypothetical protein